MDSAQMISVAGASPHQAVAEARLAGDGTDMTAAYLAADLLEAAVADRPSLASMRTIAALETVLGSVRFAACKQGGSLFQKVAGVLERLAADHPLPVLSSRAVDVLEQAVVFGSTPAHRAAADALGRLPLSPPALASDSIATPPESGRPLTLLDWDRFCTVARLRPGGKGRWTGRSLLLPADPDRLVVVKVPRPGAPTSPLHAEGWWMDRLMSLSASWPCPFHIPEPLTVAGSPVVSLKGLPRHPLERALPAPVQAALIYRCHIDYFRYANEPGAYEDSPGSNVENTFGRNAWILGRLMATGVAHTAPIPLFHNRTQAGRRSDQGRYEWRKGGRLDRWLASCRYPNVGISGLRDFEHLEPAGGDPFKRYLLMGSQVFSLVLVAGSYFRHQDPSLVGFDTDGRPVDVRDRFDRPLFARIIRSVFEGYGNGFSGRWHPFGPPVCPEGLARDLVEAMGVDRDMSEMIRVADQHRKPSSPSLSFGPENGPEGVPHATGDGVDRVLYTGPHLGGFNQALPVPDLVRFTGGTVALSIAGRFRQERSLPDAHFRKPPGAKRT